MIDSLNCKGELMASIFGCFSGGQIGDVSRLEAHLRKNGNHFKKLKLIRALFFFLGRITISLR